MSDYKFESMPENTPPPRSGGCLAGIASAFSSCLRAGRSSVVIDGKSYTLLNEIGEGAFSFVYKARCDGEEYAVKKLIIQTSEQMKEAKLEIDVMKELDHPNCLRLLGSGILPHESVSSFKNVFMVFPIVEQGNLVDLLQGIKADDEFLEEKRLLKMFRKICEAVYHLHSHNPPWAHHDIKLDNVLVSAGDEPFIMDFGSVTAARQSIRSRKEALSMQDWASRHMTSSYTPPELFDCPSRFEIDERTDVWALGCLLFAMAFGYSPFESETGSCALAVLSGDVDFPNDHPYSESFIALIMWMLQSKITSRPFVPQILTKVRDMI